MAPSLLQIEKTSETSFLDQEVIFVYEFWSNTNHDLRSTTQGFLFSGKAANGEEVAYGYVDFSELQESFMRSRINVNANGNFNANLASYLNSKNYNYKILQFAGKVLTNATESQTIKDQFIGNAKFNTYEFSSAEIPQKLVTWVLDVNGDPSAPKSIAGLAFMKSIDDYLHANVDVFLAFGGQNIQRNAQKGKWKVTKVQVTELWKKINGMVSFDPVSVTLFVNDTALSEIPYRDMVKYDIQAGDRSWVENIRLKPFMYAITQINTQTILRRESFAYQKGLLTYDWNKITDFVKYY
jgi:hypothetical protein